MRRLLTSALAAAVAGASFAVSPVYVQDWNPPSSGTPVWINNFNGYLSTLSQVKLDTTTYNYNVGIYNYQISYSGPVNVSSPREHFLCVEIDQSRYLNDYESKKLNGYVAYFANQIGNVVSMAPGTARLEKSIALALATWDFIYDSNRYAVGSQYSAGPISSSELYNGRFQLVGSFSGVSITNIENNFVNYVNAALAYNGGEYIYYHNPKFPMGDNGYSQDLISGVVPGPAAVLPFLLGFGTALRRRRSK